MSKEFECKNQNQVPEEVMKDLLGGTCQCGKQKGGESAEEMEWRYQNEVRQNEYLRKAERAIQDTMKQNTDLRERVAQYQEKISALEQEIRSMNSEDGTVDRLIQKVMDGDVAEIQISFRMKRYFDD